MSTHKLFETMRMAAVVLAATAVVAAGPAAAAGRPVTVSPGSPERMLEVSAVCPTFSWVADPAAGAHELRVYRVAEDGEPSAAATVAAEGGADVLLEAELVLQFLAPRGATSWTPPTEECLQPGGRYAWLVRSGGESGQWSEARMFRVGAEVRSELERAVERVLARFLREGRLAPGGLSAVRALAPGVEDVPTGADPLAGESPGAAATPEPPSQATTTGQSALFAELAKATGAVTFGVKGVSHSNTADSAGVLGYSDAASGKTYGVLGVTDATSGRAVEGYASADVGTTYGLSGIASSTAGRGVRGTATATSGPTQGVQGTAFSPSGFGGLFQNAATGGSGLLAVGGGEGAADLVLGGASGLIASQAGNLRLRAAGGGSEVTVDAAGQVVALKYTGDGSGLTNLKGIGANAVGSAEIIDGSITFVDIDTSTVQRRILASCTQGESIRSVAVDGSVTCQSPALSIDLGPFTSPAPVGGSGGSPFSLSCPTGLLATGLDGRAGSSVDQVRMRCQEIGSVDVAVDVGLIPVLNPAVTLTAPAGGSGGSSFSLFCPNGYVLTGLSGRVGLGGAGVVDLLRLNCGEIGGAGTFTSGPVGSVFPSSVAFSRSCPSGKVVTRLDGRAGSLIDQLRIFCQ